ncbi:MAG: hypothetical protein IT291_11185 [Deltaproteobacteria bacterium]|nr:hypothetical protein [Deltaproteobacteria bacterium]
MELLRDISAMGRENVSLAGGKAASLGEMVSVGIPVPPGFVILSSTFDKFLDETKLREEVDAILGSLNHTDLTAVQTCSEKIRSLFLNATLPQEVTDKIRASFRYLNARFVAVRSSATAEDSANAAWAGQLESYLNTTEETLLENVRKCWASLFTPRAIFYRFEKGLQQQKISVAVIVQKMVQSAKSGIAFSADPISGSSGQLIIEASLGLGEAIVSGQLTPDSYVVEKNPLCILKKDHQTQAEGLYLAEGGGTEWRPIPKEQGEGPVLSDKEVFELSELILKIEAHYGFPCDVEWACEGGIFYIVQSRPITALTKNTPIYQENSPPAPNTFQHEGVQYELVFKEYFPPFWNYQWDNREYHREFKKILGIDPAVISIFVDGTELEKCFSTGISAALHDKVEMQFSRTNVAAGLEEFELKLALFEKGIKEIAHCTKLSEQAKILKGTLDLLSGLNAYSNAYYLATPFLETIVYDFARKRFNNIEAVNRFMAQECQPIRPTPLGRYSEAVVQAAMRLKKRFGAEVIAKLEKESITDDLIDQELTALQKDFFWFTSFSVGKPRSKDSFVADIINALTKPSDSISRVEPLEIPKDIADAIYAIRVGAYVKDILSSYTTSFFWFETQPVWESIARRLGLSVADIELLTYDEVLDTQAEGEELKRILARRKEGTVFIYTEETGLRIIEGDQAASLIRVFSEQLSVESTGPMVSEFAGVAGSRGVATGKVQKILKSSELTTFENDRVLVAKYTAPEFVPAMKKAKALVTDIGGITCHAAIVARELGIPCVVGTKVATTLLRNDDFVTVDANNGLVRILDKQPCPD